jgi:excinuclease ABC subunit C
MKRDARHYAFIKVTRGPAPKLLVVRGPSGDNSSVYYGPFQGANQLQEAVRELSDALGLRDCTTERRMIFSDQQELFQIQRTPGCIRHEIKKCLGPCVGGCSAREYDERVTQARAFLDGANDGPMESLRVQMEGASEALLYERAAALRDKLHRLEMLREQFARLRFALETLSFVYTVPGFNGEDRVYVIRRGLVRAERSRPRSTRDRRSLDRLVSEIFAPDPPKSATVPTHEIDELLLLSSWFRRFPDELTRTQAIA